MKSAMWLASMLVLGSCVESTNYTPLGELRVSVPLSFDVRDGGTAKLPVTVVRGEGHSNAISLEVVGLPTGLTAEPAEIPAGETTTSIIVRADGATIDVEFPFSVEATSLDTTVAASGTVYVLGKVGTVQSSFTTTGGGIAPHLVGRWSGTDQLAFSIFPTQVFLYTHAGEEQRPFAVDGTFDYGALLDDQGNVDGASELVANQSDGKTIIVTNYDDSALSGALDGVMLLRGMPDGAFDSTFGAGANGIVLHAFPGYFVRRIGVGENNQFVVWAQGTTNNRVLMRFDANGALMMSQPLGAEGDLGTEIKQLLVQKDGKVVAGGTNATSSFVVRYNANFTVDTSFGSGGTIQLGTRAPYVISTADGYVAMGATAAGPTMWRLDPSGKLAPGFTAAGKTHPQMTTGYYFYGTEIDGRIVGVAKHFAFLALASLGQDGTPDVEYGRGGIVDTLAVSNADTGFEAIPLSHSRLYVTALEANSMRLKAMRLWY